MLASQPRDRLALSCLVGVLDGGHGGWCSSRYTLVLKVFWYATGVLDSFLSEGDAPDHDVCTVMAAVDFSDLKAGRPTRTRCCFLLLWVW